jgi:superfamily II DNA or RNA helicase
MARDVEDYRHCEYQAAMAAIIASRPGKVTVAVAPTGSGKTWVQGLVAKHFCRLG